MANWETQGTNSSFETKPYSAAAIDGRSAERAGSNMTIGGLGNMNVVGINAARVPEVRQQINDSVTNLKNIIDKIGQNAESNTAYKSEAIKPQVDAYIDSVKAYCKALISNLLAFSDKLKDVEEAWTKSMESMSSTVGTATSGMSAFSTEYVEQK